MNTKATKIFLRLALATAFLSAVADRMGMWPVEVSVWGDWTNFVQYTAVINPWLPEPVISVVAIIATLAEVVFAIFLIVGFKTELTARLSGILLLMFGLAMTFSTGVKGAFDYSVFTAAAAAFALSLMKEKCWELDNLIFGKSSKR